MDQPTVNRSNLVFEEIREVGRLQIGKDAHGKLWRIKGDGTCVPAANSAPAEDDGPELYDICVVVNEQLENAPDHWCLFVGPENSKGHIIQVKGDPWPGMARADSTEPTNIFISKTYRFSRRIGQVSLEKLNEIVQIANGVLPPKAEKVHPSNPNCQNWTCWVVRELEDAELVTEGSTDFLVNMVGKHSKDW